MKIRRVTVAIGRIHRALVGDRWLPLTEFFQSRIACAQLSNLLWRHPLVEGVQEAFLRSGFQFDRRVCLVQETLYEKWDGFGDLNVFEEDDLHEGHFRGRKFIEQDVLVSSRPAICPETGRGQKASPINGVSELDLLARIRPLDPRLHGDVLERCCAFHQEVEKRGECVRGKGKGAASIFLEELSALFQQTGDRGALL